MSDGLSLNNYLLNFDLTPRALDKMQVHFEMLVKHSKEFNLTAITDYADIANKHFLDSLTAHEFIKSGDKVIDIGTGAGFPGLPLAAMCKDASFTLVDATLKKVSFLNDVITKGGFKNVVAIQGRAEELTAYSISDIKYRSKFNIVVSRALKPLNILLELAIPFLKVGGKLVAYKATNAENEIDCAKNALKMLGCHIVTQKTVLVDNNTRVLIVVEKIKETHEMYPRSYARIKAKPL